MAGSGNRIGEFRMRVSSAAPVRALPAIAFAFAFAFAACGAPGHGGDGGAGGSASAGSGGATGGSGGAAAGTMGTGGAAGSGGGNGGSDAAGSGGSAVAGAGGARGGAGGSSAGRGGATGGVGGAAGTAGTGGTAGSAAPIVIPGSGNCTPPGGANVADAAAAYAKWKTDLLTSDGANGFLRVRRPNSSGAAVNSTVSEGIAYGMLLSVYANDQPTFDKLWQYSQHWLDGNKLMNWYISPDGTSVLGTGAASDADEDMAYALIAADARWGGKGSLSTNYIDLANTQINLIWQYEVDHSHADVLLPGDTGFNTSPLVINISYFAPAYYKAFGKVTGQTANWNNVAKTSYDIIELTLNAQNGNQSNGLVPAWSTNAGVPMAPSGSPGMPIWHQLDSCRTPFRVAVDYCWNAEPRALTYLQKITGFYSGIGAANIVDGYDLNGNPHPTNVTTGGPRAASFNGPAGVGAMATGATYATLRDQAYAGVATLTQLAGSTYYQESWTGLSLQFMTGLFPAPR
jgi:endo-1,4-beta-D-glucanase Y